MSFGAGWAGQSATRRAFAGGGAAIAGLVAALPARAAAVPAAAGPIDVTAFGAVGDGLHDDAPAINRTLDAARQRNGVTETFNPGCRIVFPPGAYAVHASLNLTGFTGVNTLLDGQGSILIGRCTGQPVLDALGSRGLTIRDLRIGGDNAAMPSTGLQIGRLSLGPADDMLIDDVKIVGSFGLACLYNRASETSLFQHVMLWNDHTAGYCLIQDGMNRFGVASPHAATALAAGENTSFNENLFVNCDFLHSGGGANVWLGDTARHRFVRCYSATQGGPSFLVFTGAVGHTMLDVDCHCETTGLRDVFLFDGLLPEQVVQGFAYKDHECFAAHAVLSAAPAIRTVMLQNARIEVARMPEKACRIFADPARFRMTGCYYGATSGFWNPPPGFKGIASIGDGFTLSAQPEAVDLAAPRDEAEHGVLFRDARSNRLVTWTETGWVDALGRAVSAADAA